MLHLKKRFKNRMKHIQLDLFEHLTDREREYYELKKLQDDISRMRRSFFVRLDAHEKKYEQILNRLERRL